MPNIVIYHSNCPDGLGAAAVLYYAAPDTTTFIPGTYGDPLPEALGGDLSDTDVYVVDFSYSREILDALQTRVRTLVVIDHHKTAEEALRGAPYAHFDMAHSGAVLTWKYNYPERAVPQVLQYLEDRDLWLWALPRSKEVSAALGAKGLGPERIEAFAGHIDTFDVEQVANVGAELLAWQDVMVCRLAESSWVVGKSRIVNTPLFQSEVCNRLLELHPDCQVAVAYMDKPGNKRIVSLRSRKNGPDVSVLAKAHGGGGHPQAAGYVTTPLPGEFTP